MSVSSKFELLHEQVKRWVAQQKWNELRDIQERAIEPILNADCDVIISAATAAGKTEAAFLPACTKIINHPSPGVGILYISPLKALINDQHRRLESLCKISDLQLTPWHGDVSQSVKQRQIKTPGGIILITPESVESLLINKAHWCAQAFAGLHYIIIDEFHAFLGAERGCQLQSLMHRIEFMLGRTIPRIALSATLGDMAQIASLLRPNTKNFSYKIIESKSLQSDLLLQLRGFQAKKATDYDMVPAKLIKDLYKTLRGSSHLVFANSRKRTEHVVCALSDLCEQHNVPNEFFAHHGNLSKELRESLEARLQEQKYPTTAVCTVTLELGIDIGHVDSIAQVGSPHSVASLRQRLGRSGRRGNAAILRLFIAESVITKESKFHDRLRLATVQCAALINLLLDRWYEPAPKEHYHLSTLAHQTLSIISQYGAVRAGQLWTLLCKTGPFPLVNQQLYARLLKGLGERDLITQTRDGQLVIGAEGEKVVGHYEFYSVFKTPEEYILEYKGKVIGTVPVEKPLVVGEFIIFAGKRWEVEAIYSDKKRIVLGASKGGKPPMFGGYGPMLHDIVRKEMRRVYIKREIPQYFDEVAKEHLSEGIEFFHCVKLNQYNILQVGNKIYIATWCSDRISVTIALLLRKAELAATNIGGIIDISNCAIDRLRESINSILTNRMPTSEELAMSVPNTIVDKYDYCVPEEMRILNYGAKFFDVNGAVDFMKMLKKSDYGYFDAGI